MSTLKVKNENGEWVDVVALKGEKGSNGKSAYEIAVDNGFEGTEAEWLESLGGGQGKGSFNAIYGTTNYSEITEAIEAGKQVTCTYAGRIYNYTGAYSGTLYFTATLDWTSNYVVYITDGNVWGNNTQIFQKTNYKINEANVNSTEATDNHYYSALATKKLLENIEGADSISPSLKVFNKILCIGDSWTQGVFDYTIDNDDTVYGVGLDQYAYPTVLASLTGKKVTNKGDAGKTIKGWYDAHKDDVLSGHDACIIFLGINDIARTTTAVEREEGLNSIISKVKSENENIKVFLVSLPPHYSTNNSGKSFNNLVSGIAETTSNCYYVDIASYSDSDIKRTGHPVAIGYESLARIIYKETSKIINENTSDFMDIFTMNSTSNVEDVTRDVNKIMLNDDYLSNQVLTSNVNFDIDGYIAKDTYEFTGASNNEYTCTGLIYIKGIKRLGFKLRSDNNNVPICFYDKDMNVMSEINVGAELKSWTGEIDLTGESYKDAYYICASSYTPNYYDPYVKLTGNYDLSDAVYLDNIETKCGNNLFNYTKCTKGVDINNNGGYGYNSNSVLSDWIKLPEGADRIYFNNFPTYDTDSVRTRFGCWFDENKYPITGLDLHNNEVNQSMSIPEGARYLRFTVLSRPTVDLIVDAEGNYDPTAIKEIMVSTRDLSFEPYECYYTKINGISLGDMSDCIKEKSLEYTLGYNLFDYTNVQKDIRIDGSTGNLVIDGTGYITSNLMVIPEEHRTSMYIYNLPVTTRSRYFCYYDEDMNLIDSVHEIDATSTDKEVGLPSGAKYFVMNLYRAESSLPTNSDPYKDVLVTVKYFLTEFEPYKKHIESINDLEISATQLHDLKGKKWVGIGDSITEKNGRAKKSYYDYIVDETGVTFVNLGASGTGYQARQDSETEFEIDRAFYKRLQMIPDDVDVITIFSSFNDIAKSSELIKFGTVTDDSEETICGCINKTLDGIITAHPTIPIGVILPTPWRELNTTNSNAITYVSLLTDICKRKSIPVLDLFYGGNIRPYVDVVNAELYTDDAKFEDGTPHGIHPNSKGHKIIAPKIREFLRTLI